jgi:hypothetical protein
VRILTLTTLAQTRSLVSTAHDQGALWRRAGTGLFIALLLLASLIPGRFENSIVLFGVPVRVLEFLLVALAAVLVFLRLLQGPLPIPRDGYVPAVFSGLFAYAAVSLVWWSPVTQPDTSAMAMTLVLAAAALWSAYLVVRLQRQELHRFMSNLTTIIAGIAAIYSAQSFMGLGLRSEEGLYSESTESMVLYSLLRLAAPSSSLHLPSHFRSSSPDGVGRETGSRWPFCSLHPWGQARERPSWGSA